MKQNKKLKNYITQLKNNKPRPLCDSIEVDTTRNKAPSKIYSNVLQNGQLMTSKFSNN